MSFNQISLAVSFITCKKSKFKKLSLDTSKSHYGVNIT